MAIRRNPAPTPTPWSQNTKNGSQARCSTASVRHSRIEVPRVDYEKLSGDRVGETSASISARVQAARDIQRPRFTNHQSTDIICNTDMRIAEIRQFCKLPDEGQSLMRAAKSQLNYRHGCLTGHE